MEEQPDWPAHSALMENRAVEGFVLLVARAQDGEQAGSRLSKNPRNRNGLLRTASVAPWKLRIGSLDPP